MNKNECFTWQYRRIDSSQFQHRPNCFFFSFSFFSKRLDGRSTDPMITFPRWTFSPPQVRHVAVLQALSSAAQRSLQAGQLQGKGLAMMAKAFAELDAWSRKLCWSDLIGGHVTGHEREMGKDNLFQSNNRLPFLAAFFFFFFSGGFLGGFWCGNTPPKR